MKDILLVLEDNDGIIEFHFYSKDNEQIKWNLHVQGNMTLKENSLQRMSHCQLNLLFLYQTCMILEKTL